MKISTSFKGQKIVGVIQSHTKHFLEVEITSPYSNLKTSRSVPYFARGYLEYVGEVLAERCDELLIELYEFGKTKEKYCSEISQQFALSDIPAAREKIRKLEGELPYLKQRMRKLFIEEKITQKKYQTHLGVARSMIVEARNELNRKIDYFLENTPFSSYGYDLTSRLVDEEGCR
jgi:hypothetical protein